MINRYAVAAPLLFLALFVTGCASEGGGGGGGGTVGNTDFISRDEIVGSSRSTAWDVIGMLRPLWLRQRSAQSVNRQGVILVYVDDVRYGDLESLRTISALPLQWMRRFNATAASQRWGPGHSEGVIFLSTRPEGR